MSLYRPEMYEAAEPDPSTLSPEEFDAWVQEQAQQIRTDRERQAAADIANEGYPVGGIEMRQRRPEDADEAWKGREGPVPTRYSEFATQPPVRVARSAPAKPGVEVAEGGMRITGDRIENPREDAAMKLAAQVVGERQERPKSDAVGEALRYASEQAGQKRQDAIAQARMDEAGAGVGSDAWVAHLQHRAPTAPGRQAAAQARLSALLAQDAEATGRDGDQMAGHIAGREKESRAEAAALEMVRRERAEKEAKRDQHLSDEASRRQWEEGRDAKRNRTQIDAARAGVGREINRERRAEDRSEDKEYRTDQKKKEAAARDVEERFNNANRALNDLEAQVKSSGTFEAFGPENETAAALISDYAIDMAKMKDPESVVRPSESAAEEKALFKPGIGGLTTSNETALALIKKAREKATARRDEAYRVRGLPPPTQARPPQTQAAPGWSDADEKRLQELEARARR